MHAVNDAMSIHSRPIDCHVISIIYANFQTFKSHLT